MNQTAAWLAAVFLALAVGVPAMAQAAPAPAPAHGRDAAQALKQADKNGDGSITFEELSAVRPQLTRERFNMLDRNHDGVLNKADRGEKPGHPDARQGRGQGQPGLEMLRKADVNRDGRVTFEELKAVNPQATPERFRRLDRNGDSVLSPADAPKGAAPPAAQGKVAKADKPDMPKQAHKGGNARHQAAAKLLQADADGDGRVTYEEATAKKPGLPREAFNRYDINNDGVLSAADVPPAVPPAGPADAPKAKAPDGAGEALMKLRAADTNEDGRVSFDEAKTAFPQLTPERFKEHDRNGDGFLNREDRKPGA